MNDPCRICTDGSCYGCTIAERKSTLLYQCHDLSELARACSGEAIQELHDAGVLTHHEACALLEIVLALKTNALTAQKLCERAFAYDVFHIADEG